MIEALDSIVSLDGQANADKLQHLFFIIAPTTGVQYLQQTFAVQNLPSLIITLSWPTQDS